MSTIELPLGVLMERREARHRFAQPSWRAVAVVCGDAATATALTDEALAPATSPTGSVASSMADGPTVRVAERYWVRGLVLELTPDEALGYAQNLRCERPSVFVLWRLQDGRAQPVLATASYHAGLRMLDSGEQVDAVPLPPELAGVMVRYVEHQWARVQRDQEGERAGPRRRRGTREAAD